MVKVGGGEESDCVSMSDQAGKTIFPLGSCNQSLDMVQSVVSVYTVCVSYGEMSSRKAFWGENAAGVP